MPHLGASFVFLPCTVGLTPKGTRKINSRYDRKIIPYKFAYIIENHYLSIQKEKVREHPFKPFYKRFCYLIINQK